MKVDHGFRQFLLASVIVQPESSELGLTKRHRCRRQGKRRRGIIDSSFQRIFHAHQVYASSGFSRRRRRSSRWKLRLSQRLDSHNLAKRGNLQRYRRAWPVASGGWQARALSANAAEPNHPCSRKPTPKSTNRIFRTYYFYSVLFIDLSQELSDYRVSSNLSREKRVPNVITPYVLRIRENGRT